MTHATAPSAQELDALLARRRQLSALLLAEQNRLTHPLTESVRQNVVTRLAQLSRFLNEVNTDLTQLLQTPLRPGARGGLCCKAFRE